MRITGLTLVSQFCFGTMPGKMTNQSFFEVFAVDLVESGSVQSDESIERCFQYLDKNRIQSTIRRTQFSDLTKDQFETEDGFLERN